MPSEAPSRESEPVRHWPRAGVSAAIFRDGKVLLGQRSKPPLTGVWSLPGGHIEPGEKAIDAVRRELAEETGIEADIRGVADVVDVILHEDSGEIRAHYVITVFYGDWRSGEAIAGSDCMAIQWADPDELESLPLTQGAAEVIGRIRKLMGDATAGG